jgi:hypothetical protein
MAKIELATYVEALRGELQHCIEMSAGKDLRFATDKIDLEIEVGVETEVAGKERSNSAFSSLMRRSVPTARAQLATRRPSN